jgi:P-type Cu+ transporter
VLVAIDGPGCGNVVVAEQIKSTSAEAVAQLHALGRQIVMLTGDNRLTAKSRHAQIMNR